MKMTTICSGYQSSWPTPQAQVSRLRSGSHLTPPQFWRGPVKCIVRSNCSWMEKPNDIFGEIKLVVNCKIRKCKKWDIGWEGRGWKLGGDIFGEVIFFVNCKIEKCKKWNIGWESRGWKLGGDIFGANWQIQLQRPERNTSATISTSSSLYH